LAVSAKNNAASVGLRYPAFTVASLAPRRIYGPASRTALPAETQFRRTQGIYTQLASVETLAFKTLSSPAKRHQIASSALLIAGCNDLPLLRQAFKFLLSLARSLGTFLAGGVVASRAKGLAQSLPRRHRPTLTRCIFQSALAPQCTVRESVETTL
jgi:hypothetical protein